MPISHSWLDNQVSAILEALAGAELSGAGGAAYRYAASAKVSLQPDEPVMLIPPAAEKVRREVTVKLLSEHPAYLSWGAFGEHRYRLLTLEAEDDTFKDWADGGLSLWAVSSFPSELEVIVRSDKIIDFKIGGVEAVAIVGVRLLVDTTKDYAANISDGDIYSQVMNLTGSDDALAGHKLFQITGFNPHEELTFNVEVSPFAGLSGTKIDVQWLSNFELIKVLFQVGINAFIFPPLADLISGQGELGKAFKHAALVPGIAGGELKLKPDFGFNIGRFVGVSSFAEAGDTLVVTGYTPNSQNPEQGGTFTLGGF